MATKREKIENNLMYLEEQVEKFLRHEYRIKYRVNVYGNKSLDKKGLFTQIIIENGKPVGIDVNYKLLTSGKERLLKETLREAVRIALWYMRRPYKDGSKEFEMELKRKGLPSYGGVSHKGKELHTYGCPECKRIYMLKERKLPKGKNPALQNIVTPCCEVRFSYEGKIFYNNEKLQKLARHLGK